MLVMLRILGYLAICLLTGLLMPAYHPGFRLGWTGISMYFGMLFISLLLRIIGQLDVYLLFNDVVLTPALFLLLALLWLNVRRISRKPGDGKLGQGRTG